VRTVDVDDHPAVLESCCVAAGSCVMEGASSGSTGGAPAFGTASHSRPAANTAATTVSPALSVAVTVVGEVMLANSDKLVAVNVSVMAESPLVSISIVVTAPSTSTAHVVESFENVPQPGGVSRLAHGTRCIGSPALNAQTALTKVDSIIWCSIASKTTTAAQSAR